MHNLRCKQTSVKSFRLLALTVLKCIAPQIRRNIETWEEYGTRCKSENFWHTVKSLISLIYKQSINQVYNIKQNTSVTFKTNRSYIKRKEAFWNVLYLKTLSKKSTGGRQKLHKSYDIWIWEAIHLKTVWGDRFLYTISLF